MKLKYKERLQVDLVKYCDQIGILPNERPRLVLDRKEMRALVYGKVTNSDRIGGWGQCFYSNRTVFVDGSKKIQRIYKKYRGKYVYRRDPEDYYRLIPICIRRRTRYSDFLD